MHFLGKLDKFNEIAICEHSREDQTGLCNLITILIINLIPMAMAL
jgi:hypothetical protein